MKKSLQTEKILKVSSTERDPRVTRVGVRAEGSRGNYPAHRFAAIHPR